MQTKVFKSRVSSVLIVALLMPLWMTPALMAAPRALQNNAYVLPVAKAGTSYEFLFRSDGGLAPLTWRVTQGALPPGLQLDPQGKLSGTPRQAQREPYHFVVEVADAAQTPERVTQACSLLVQAAPLRIVLNQPLRILPPDNIRTAAPSTDVAPTTNGHSSEPATSAPLRRELADPTANLAPRAISPQASNNSVAAGTPANSAPQAATTAATPTPTPTPTPATATKHKICGRLRPASMDQVISLIQRSGLIRDTKINAYMRAAGFNKLSTAANAAFSCDEYLGPDATGTERKAIIALLNRVLGIVRGTIEPSDEPEDLSARSTKPAGKSEDLKVQSAKRKGQAGASWQNLFSTGVYNTAGLSERTLEKLLELVTNYVGSIRIVVKSDTDKIVATTSTNSDGQFVLSLDNNNSDDGKHHYFISTDANSNFAPEQVRVAGVDQQVNLLIEDRPVSLLTRAVVGYQQAGAASAEFEQNYFFDLFVSQTLPMKFKIDPDFGERWRSWIAARSASLPQNGDVTLSNLSLSFAEKAGGLRVRDVARVFDVLGGLEVRILQNRALLPSFARDTKQKFSLSFIGSFGFVTPTDPTNLPPIFKLTEPIKQKLSDPQSKLLTSDEVMQLKDRQFIAFANADRDRFFRQYYAGFRVQTFFFNRHDVPMQRFPAQLDITYGQNEYVTGGRVRGGVFRFDGYFPLPYEGLKFINLYGTAVIKPARAQISRGILLEPVTGTDAPTISDERVFQFSRPQFNRDYYKVGVGIDFVSFIDALRKLKTGN